jgi:hypothetical protein
MCSPFVQILGTIAKLQKQSKAMKSELLRNNELSDDTTAALRKVAAADKRVALMRCEFPSEARFLLRAILGEVNVRLPHQSDRHAYKSAYESFKLYGTYAIIVACAIVLGSDGAYRTQEKMFHFLVVWYNFCISIREHVLIQNGSQIKAWWRMYGAQWVACCRGICPA